MLREDVANNLVALPTAAATAYLALTGRHQPPVEGLLDVAAIALSTCIPTHGVRGAEAPRRLSDAEPLAVTAGDFAGGLARLQRAGVNFAHARVPLPA